jgi:GNAT superfamily N-acetyltransferase
MKRVILSSTISETYDFFLPITAWLWKNRIGYEPIIFLVGTRSEWAGGRPGVVLAELEHEGYRIEWIERIQGVPDANVSMSIRQHAAALPDLDPGDILMVGDVDMLPIRREFYHQHDPSLGPVAIYHAGMYGDTYWPAYGLSLLVSAWREVMDLSPGHLMDSLRKTFATGKIEELIAAQKADYKDSRLWYFDEHYPSARIRGSRFFSSLIRIQSDGSERLCRHSWPDVIYTASYIDCHSLRPGWSVENWGRVRSVLAQVMPEHLAWIDGYAALYVRTGSITNPASSYRATRSDWDSEVFGCRIGLLSLKDRPCLKAVIQEENRSDFDVVFVKADGWQSPPGASAIDQLYEMDFSGPPAPADAPVVELQSPGASHLAISREAFSDSRFARDPRLQKKTPEFYEKWLSGNGTIYSLAALAGDAFIVVNVDPPGVGRISLLATLESSRGSGLGTALVQGVLAQRADLKTWRVRVSARNVRAIRFYESLRFKVKWVQTAFHIWMKDEG